MQVLNSGEATPAHLDGALHMVGILAPQLLKKKVYKRELENMLLHHVLPRTGPDSDKFLRARVPHPACPSRTQQLGAVQGMWCCQVMSEAPLSTSGLEAIVRAVLRCLLEDAEIPVRTEAAIAMQLLLADQPQGSPRLPFPLHPFVRSGTMQRRRCWSRR